MGLIEVQTLESSPVDIRVRAHPLSLYLFDIKAAVKSHWNAPSRPEWLLLAPSFGSFLNIMFPWNFLNDTFTRPCPRTGLQVIGLLHIALKSLLSFCLRLYILETKKGEQSSGSQFNPDFLCFTYCAVEQWIWSHFRNRKSPKETKNRSSCLKFECTIAPVNSVYGSSGNQRILLDFIVQNGPLY